MAEAEPAKPVARPGAGPRAAWGGGSSLRVGHDFVMSTDDENLNRAIELLRAPCVVRKLNIVGNRRTKRALIEAELKAALAAKTHEDLAVELALASQRLKDLDVFKSASCEVDVVPEGKPGDVNVSVQVDLMFPAVHFPL